MSGGGAGGGMDDAANEAPAAYINMGRGASAARNRFRASAVAAYGTFVKHDDYLGENKQPRYAVRFADLSEDELVCRQLYGLYAQYLASHHQPHNGRDSGCMQEDTCVAYLRCLLLLAQDRITEIYQDKNEAPPFKYVTFFQCLQGVGEPGQWLGNVKFNIRSLLFDRMMDEGKDPLAAATVRRPLYRNLIEALVRNYSLYRPEEAECAVRKFSILLARLCCGRAAEQAFLDVNMMEWDPHFQCVVAIVPMPKVKRSPPAAQLCTG